jgi:hypothetical protein
MREHEFYADPTVFDHWHARLAEWFFVCSEKVGPYAWVIAFAALGSAMVMVSITALGAMAHDNLAGATVAWNQSLARGLTVLIGLLAAQRLFRQALGAWPGQERVPQQLQNAGRYVGWRRESTARPSGDAAGNAAPVMKDRRKPQSASVKAFSAGVRASGVNVSIARALFAAGIRSPRQVQLASDEQLQTISGVGPATISKLRAQFGQPSSA